MTVQYLLPAPAAPIIKTYIVRANSRLNIWVNKADARLDDAEVSAVITSTNGVPLIVERACPEHQRPGVPRRSRERRGRRPWSGSSPRARPARSSISSSSWPIRARRPPPSRHATSSRTAGHHADVRGAGQSRLNIWVDLEARRCEDTGVHDAPLDQRRADHRGAGDVVADRRRSTAWYEGHNGRRAADRREVGTRRRRRSPRAGQPDLRPGGEHSATSGRPRSR